MLATTSPLWMNPTSKSLKFNLTSLHLSPKMSNFCRSKIPKPNSPSVQSETQSSKSNDSIMGAVTASTYKNTSMKSKHTPTSVSMLKKQSWKRNTSCPKTTCCQSSATNKSRRQCGHVSMKWMRSRDWPSKLWLKSSKNYPTSWRKKMRSSNSSKLSKFKRKLLRKKFKNPSILWPTLFQTRLQGWPSRRNNWKQKIFYLRKTSTTT